MMLDKIHKRATNLDNLQTKVKPTRAVSSSDLPLLGEKARLLSENEQLIDLAFYQEQISIVELSKLRISHDIRNVFKFRKYIQDVIEGRNIDFDFEEEEVKNKKKRIENLKKAIEYEKSRIYSMQTPQFEINEAAKLIQKIWRGYYQRQQIEKHKYDEIYTEYDQETDETDEFDDYNDDSSSFETIDDNFNNTKDDDNVIGVFNVTGVTNIENPIDDDNKSDITPADALDTHKSIKTSSFLNKPPKLKNAARDVKQRKREIDKVVTMKRNINEIKKNSSDNKMKSLKPNELILSKQNKEKNKLNVNTNYRSWNRPNRIINIHTEEILRKENLNQQIDHKTQQPINIKTYMCD